MSLLSRLFVRLRAPEAQKAASAINRYAAAQENESRDSAHFVLYAAPDLEALMTAAGLSPDHLPQGRIAIHPNKPDDKIKRENWLRAEASIGRTDDTLSYSLHLCSRPVGGPAHAIHMTRLRPGHTDRATAEKLLALWEEESVRCAVPPPETQKPGTPAP